MKYSYGVIHAYFECDDCGWKTTSYKNAQAIAAIHARTHKHNVDGEIANRVAYFGREEKKK